MQMRYVNIDESDNVLCIYAWSCMLVIWIVMRSHFCMEYKKQIRTGETVNGKKHGSSFGSFVVVFLALKIVRLHGSVFIPAPAVACSSLLTIKWVKFSRSHLERTLCRGPLPFSWPLHFGYPTSDKAQGTAASLTFSIWHHPGLSQWIKQSMQG